MCGRQACTLAPDQVSNACQYRDKDGNVRRPQWVSLNNNGGKFTPSPNIGPKSTTPILMSQKKVPVQRQKEKGEERVLCEMQWGLVPSWHKGSLDDFKFNMINCRSDTILEKASFRGPLDRGQRCVAVAEGFFEWKSGKDGKKQPYFIHVPMGKEDGKVGEMDETKFDVKKEGQNKDGDIKDNVGDVKCDVSQSKTGVKIEDETQGKDGKLSEDGKPSKDGKLSLDGKPLKDGKLSMDCKLTNMDKVGVKTEEQTQSKDAKLSDGKPSDAKLSDGKPSDGKLAKTDKPGAKTGGDAQTKDGKPAKIHKRDTESDTEIHSSRRLVHMAALYDTWKSPGSIEPFYTYTIITVDSSSSLNWLHERMPAILETDEQVNKWLDVGEVPKNEALKLLKPVNSLHWYPVSTFVNNVRNKSAECMKEIDLSKKTVKSSGSSSLMGFWLKKSPRKHEKEADCGPASKKIKTD